MAPPRDLHVDLSRHAAASVSGRWAVGVSGGADSVALLLHMLDRPATLPPLLLHVVHLDHQTRGDASTGDARFVADLAAKLGIACTHARRDAVESALTGLSSNLSARYRTIRHALFRSVVAEHRLQGVLLAHHADDQAETVLQRLLRGSGPAGLTGMAENACVDGLLIRRPLLSVRRNELRRYLNERGQSWREDASNASDQYLRNRVRQLIARHPHITPGLLDLAEACRSVQQWVVAAAPELPERFDVNRLNALPAVLARESARRWLIARGVPPDRLHRAADGIDRLIAQSADSATPSQQIYPAGLQVRRRGGVVWRVPI